MSAEHAGRGADVVFTAYDGHTITGTLFTGSGNGPLVLISSAAAVPRGYYSRFARHLVDMRGFRAVLTYDYRGVGGSQDKAFSPRRLRMRDWALKDMPAALDFLSAQHPGHPVVGIGQSFGGQALGLSGRAADFLRYLMIAPMSGYWRGTDEPWKVLLSMNLIGVPASHLIGRTPRGIGLAESLPAGVFIEWARWCRLPGYFFDDPTLSARDTFSAVTTPILAIGMSDDPWATERAQHGLMKHYVNAPVTRRWITPEDAGAPVGHIGFFRSRFAETLWPVATEWLACQEKINA
jgi:Predicted alpha/beta hydrolase